MKFLLLIFSFSLSYSLQGQINPKLKNSVPKIGAYPDKDVVVYKNAISLGDLETVTVALHNIVAANPNGGIYKDTLALVYLERGYFRQAQLLTKTLYLEKENDTRTEILAICAKQLNQPIEAIELYKKLFINTQKSDYLFEKLQLEYQIKRLKEAKISAEQLLSLITMEDQTQLNVPKLDNKTRQQVSLKAGIHYLLGAILIDLEDSVNAKDQFEKALVINKDYEMAQEALKKLVDLKN